MGFLQPTTSRVPTPCSSRRNKSSGRCVVIRSKTKRSVSIGNGVVYGSPRCMDKEFAAR